MTNDKFKNILARLETVSRRYFIIGIAEAFCVAFAVLGVCWIAASLAESVLYLSPRSKGFIFALLYLLPLAVFSLYCAFLYFLRPDTEELSRMVERAYPHFKDRLISAVQLGSRDSKELFGQSSSLVEALIVNVEAEIKNCDLIAAVSLKRLLFSARALYCSLFALFALFMLFPNHFGEGQFRLADHSRSYSKPGNISIHTLINDTSVIRGENFSTPGFVSGGSTKPLHLFYRWDGSSVWNAKPVEADPTTGDFTVTIEKPRQSFHYYLESGSFATARRSVTVIERPAVETIAQTHQYPEYTGIGTVTPPENDGNIRVLQGTKVSMIVGTNKPLSSMAIIRSDSVEIPFAVKGNEGRTQFTVSDNIDYHIALTDTLGIKNKNPITYRVTSLIDEYPLITIESPSAETTLARSMVLPILYRASDDYGVRLISLSFAAPYIEAQTRKLYEGNSAQSVRDVFEWNLSDLNLLPDDSVTYVVEVYDNDVLNGPKKSVSDTMTVRVPSMTDLMSSIADEQDEGIDMLRDMAEQSGKMNPSLEKMKRDIINGEEQDWSDTNALETEKKRMENIRENMKDISETMRETAQRLSEEDMAALETVEKYREISELMDEIAEGDLKEALKQLTQAQMEIDPNLMKQALDNYTANAEELKKKLDNIIKLLEQAKAIQRFETARRLLEEMTLKQAEMTQKYNENPEDETLAREQAKIASDMENLQQELSKTAEELKEKFDLNTESLEDFLASNNISETMKDASGNMSRKSKEQAKEDLNKTNSMLSELLSEMDALGSAMRSMNSEELRYRLFTSLYALLAVSESQELLLGEASKNGLSATNSENNERLAMLQLEVIDGLNSAEKTASGLSELIVELASVLDQLFYDAESSMQSAVNSFATGNKSLAVPRADKALATINNTIFFLTNILKQSEDNGMGMPGDLLQQLENIANGQMSLQMKMGSEQMMQLAAEQGMLSQQLAELSRKVEQDRQLREMLEKLTAEMDDTAASMKRNEDREKVERKQLDIYRRLLDARRSRREKDEKENERKSRTAENDTASGAESLADDLGEKRPDINAFINRAMQDDFNPEYMRLIRRYFESMLKDSEGQPSTLQPVE